MKRYTKERGQGMTEYAILLMLVGGMLVALLGATGMSIRKTFCRVTNAMYMGNMPEEGNDGFAACRQLLAEDGHDGEDGGHCDDHGDDGEHCGEHEDGHDGEHGGHDGEHDGGHGFLWDLSSPYYRG